MTTSYARDLDLNLLRVFVVVADAGSVTRAAERLYLTQPAISAALRRLTAATGAPLFARQGRGITLTSRGERLLAEVKPRLAAMVDATLAPPLFDPRTSERVVRLGLADTAEAWLLPGLLRALEREAPNMRIIASPVQFRSVQAVLERRDADMAVTVADEMPSTIRRQRLLFGKFACLFDPRFVKVKREISERAYFAHGHVIVSYSGDLRGIVEDMLHKTRRVRCSVSSFNNIGAIVEGSALLATVPVVVAEQACAARPVLRTARLPFEIEGGYTELLWPAVTDDDDACRFVRHKIREVAPRRAQAKGKSRE